MKITCISFVQIVALARFSCLSACDFGIGSDDDQQSDSTDSSSRKAERLCGASPGKVFCPSHPWNQVIVSAPLDSESEEIVNFLQANHPESMLFQMDGPSAEPNNTYGQVILYDDGSAPIMPLVTTDDFFTPDCDPASVPVPERGALQNNTGYRCEYGGDCHFLVVNTSTCRLHEVWRADSNAGTLTRAE